MKASLPPEQDPDLEVLETSESHFPLAVSVANATELPATAELPEGVEPIQDPSPESREILPGKISPKKDPVRIKFPPKPAAKPAAITPPVTAAPSATAQSASLFEMAVKPIFGGYAAATTQAPEPPDDDEFQMPPPS